MTTPNTPKTGDYFAFRATGNVVKLGEEVEGGYSARYIDGPSKGQHTAFSADFLKRCGVRV